MRAIELHFNPKSGEDIIFDSFCFEPENLYEKRLGNLYLVGELTNTLPQNYRLLDNLSRVIKDKFYKFSAKYPEKSLKESLKQANEFLDGEVKKENVSWMGNFNFAVLSLNGFELNFTKVGKLKVLLLRDGQIIDIGKNLEFQEIEPYPLKIFGNIASGKLVKEDIILILTKEIFDFFNSEKIIQEIAGLPIFEEKKLSQILKEKEEELSQISGVCLLINLKKEALLEKPKLITFSKKVEKVTISQVLFPLKEGLAKLIQKPKKTLENLKNEILGIFRLPKIKLGWKMPGLKFSFSPLFSAKKKKIQIKESCQKFEILFYLRKNLILIGVLILLVFFGFLIFRNEKIKNLEKYQLILTEIEGKVSEANKFLIIKDTHPALYQKAESLLVESWEKIQPLLKNPELPPSLRSQVLSLKKSIEDNLAKLNNLETIEGPELFFEFDSRIFTPQKMLILGKNLYFLDSSSETLFKLNQTKEKEIFQDNLKFNLAISLNDSLLFFSNPNFLIPFQDNQFKETTEVEPPYLNFNFEALVNYNKNLYFLDKKNNKIVKYSYLESFVWGKPQLWLKKEASFSDVKSITIDGSIWVLKENNSVDRYYLGEFRENLNLNFFPSPKDITKIFTSPTLPYLYLLEPSQKRIIILTKKGEIVKQYQSEKFDNLSDFSVSTDNKTIYLLNGLKVYQIVLKGA